MTSTELGSDVAAQAVRDADLDEAIGADLRFPVAAVDADWDGDGLFGHDLSHLADMFDVTSLSVNRELSGGLPPEVGLVNGRASATAQVTLAARAHPLTGEVEPDSTDPIAAFAPYNPDAALFGTHTIGTDVEIATGFDTASGPQLLRRFTGAVSRVVTSRADQTVTVEALDLSTRMRAPIYLPPWGLDSLLLDWYGPERYSSRANTQWLVDYIFRTNGYYASPPPPATAFLSATMHGSSIPEIGTGGIPQQVESATPSGAAPWAVGNHPYSMLAPNPAARSMSGYWYADQQLTMNPGTGFACEFLIQLPDRPISPFLMGASISGGAFTANTTYAVLVTLESGVPGMSVIFPSGGTLTGRGLKMGISRAVTPTWVHVGMHWGFRDGTVEMGFALNGVRFVPSTFAIDIGKARSQPWAPATRMEYDLGVPMTNISWFPSPEFPEEWAGVGHVPTCDIDPGANELYGIPQLTGEDGWDLVTELAGAELARCGVTEAGRPFFRSRAVRRPRGEAQRLTSQRELSDLVATTDEASVRNSISAAATPTVCGDWEPVVEAKERDQYESGPGTTTFVANLPAGCVDVSPQYSLQVPNKDYWDLVKDEPSFRDGIIFCAVYAGKRTVLVPSQFVDVRIFPKNAGQLAFTIYNTSGQTIRFCTESQVASDGTVTEGEPAFRIPGRMLTEAATVPQAIRDPGSIKRFGERTFDLSELGADRWHQHLPSMAGIGEAVLAGTAYPVPVLDSVKVPHDPRRALEDPVVAVDPDGLGEAPGTIVAVTEDHAPEDMATDTVTIRPLMPPGFGVLDDEVYGIVNRTLRFGA